MLKYYFVENCHIYVVDGNILLKQLRQRLISEADGIGIMFDCKKEGFMEEIGEFLEEIYEGRSDKCEKNVYLIGN